MTRKASLLASFAHPDDEAFGTGGTLAHYTSNGVRVALICATNGEVGEISDPGLATPETLGTVREAELRCAAQALGVAEVLFLGYRDSGMAGTPENHDSRAFINVPSDVAVRRIVTIMRGLRPTVVITFEPNGGYGHPDHIAINRHTVTAFHAAADPHQYADCGPAWQASRLFYSAIPRSFFLGLRDRMEAMGIDTSEFARFDEDSIGWPDDQIHCSLDVSHTLSAKWAALECHRTQFGPDNLFRRLPDEVLKQLLSREHFALAWPEPQPGLQLPDLFAGL